MNGNVAARSGEWAQHFSNASCCVEQVEQCRLVGIMLLVFARTSLYDAIKDVDDAEVGTGLLGMLVRRCFASAATSHSAVVCICHRYSTDVFKCRL